MTNDDVVLLARKHVSNGRAIVARQRALIKQIKAQRRDPKDAEELLIRFESTLRLFEDDLASFEKDE